MQAGQTQVSRRKSSQRELLKILGEACGWTTLAESSTGPDSPPSPDPTQMGVAVPTASSHSDPSGRKEIDGPGRRMRHQMSSKVLFEHYVLYVSDNCYKAHLQWGSCSLAEPVLSMLWVHFLAPRTNKGWQHRNQPPAPKSQL